jgi:hypothetical protein
MAKAVLSKGVHSGGKKSHLWGLNPGPTVYKTVRVSYEEACVLQAGLQDEEIRSIVLAWKELPAHIRSAIHTLVVTTR